MKIFSIGANPRGGTPTYYLGQFSPKTCTKMKRKLDQGSGVCPWSHPFLNLPMVTEGNNCVLRIVMCQRAI